MIDAFTEPQIVEVQVQDPLVDIFDEPPVVIVSIDPDRAPRSRQPKQTPRFPNPRLQVNVLVLPIENSIYTFPVLSGAFVIS
jgi:hypothetical protein